MKAVVRYAVAIVAAQIIGQLIALPFGFLIDALYGHPVTGGHFPLNAGNVTYLLIMGFVTGFSAAYIARRHPILIAAAAQFFPLLLLTAIELYRNRVMPYDHILVEDWTWLGLLPALAAGTLCRHYGRRSLVRVMAVFGAVAGLVAGVGGIAIHAYTTFLAYKLAGPGAAFVTLSFPVISELYWAYVSWVAVGRALSQYDYWLLLYVVFSASGIGCLFLAGTAEERIARAESAHIRQQMLGSISEDRPSENS